MPSGKIVTPQWDEDTGDIRAPPQALMPKDSNTDERTIFFQSCVDREKMGIYYINVTYTTPDYWTVFTTYDNGSRLGTTPSLITSYEDESCNNLFVLLNVSYTGIYQSRSDVDNYD